MNRHVKGTCDINVRSKASLDGIRSISGVDCIHTAGMKNVGFLEWMDWRMLVSPFVSELYI